MKKVRKSKQRTSYSVLWSIENYQANYTLCVPKILKLDKLAVFILIQYFKVKNGLDDIMFLKEPKILKSKRPHDQKIEREVFNKCNQKFNFLTNRIATTWNKLPSKVIEAQSLNSFKARLAKHMSSHYLKNQQY